MIDALIGIDALVAFSLFGMVLTLSSSWVTKRILDEPTQKKTKYDMLLAFIFFASSVFCIPIKMFFLSNNINECVILSAIVFILFLISGVYFFIKGYKFQLNYFKLTVIPEVEEE